MNAPGLGLTPATSLTLGDFRQFYAQTLARRMLATTSVLLAYGGGAAMFWLHAIHRGERGPAINHWFHWVLDSSLGFLALTPLLFFILPAALWGLSRLRGQRSASLVVYAGVVGLLFALATAPGPLLHTLVAGAGTPLAEAATNLFGSDPGVAAHHHLPAVSHSPAASVLVQVAVGVPVYGAVTWLSFHVVRMTVPTRRRVRPALCAESHSSPEP